MIRRVVMSLRAALALTVIKEDEERACYESFLYDGFILPTMGPDGHFFGTQAFDFLHYTIP